MVGVCGEEEEEKVKAQSHELGSHDHQRVQEGNVTFRSIENSQNREAFLLTCMSS